MRFVQVSVNIPQVSGVFDYHLPDDLIETILPGCLVIVPFGKQRVQGIVLRFIDEPSVPETRPVEALLDPEPVITPLQMTFSQKLSEMTLASHSVCLELMLPSGMSQQADTVYELKNQQPVDDVDRIVDSRETLKPLQERILGTLRTRGSLRGRQLDVAFRHQNWKSAMKTLERLGLVVHHVMLPQPSVHPRTSRSIQLAMPPAEVMRHFESLGKPGSAVFERRQAALYALLHEPLPIEVADLRTNTGATGTDLTWLAEKGLVRFGENEVWRDPLEKIVFQPLHAPDLTTDQRAAWEQVSAQLRGQTPVKPFLLLGVTGSGKTEIYLRAVEEVLKQGRQALVLVPEIALTPQTVRRFLSRFPGQVGLVHSRLSPGERFDTWRRARAGSLPVIVGPRSALFTPLKNLGLIVVDECHDDSYYQSEPPFYHGVLAAIAYARLAGCALILGSATPEINQLYIAQREGWQILRLPRRILAHRQAVSAQMEELGLKEPPLSMEGESASLPLPPVQIVDMREELKTGNRSIFSRSLQRSLAEVLKAGQQTILFLNRRGSATYIFCRDCGYSLRCPRCDLPLTLHLDNAGSQALICHTCGYKRQVPKTCPQCGGTRIRQYGLGTEKVESEVQALFPKARTLRWDASSVQTKDAHEILLSHFVNHRADILIGTQMLAKGLDLPLVTLVGVVLADTGLNFPDYRAGERSFQLLTQVAGRAGRSPLGGKVILQTFQPELYPIQAAATHNFEDFYTRELEYRRIAGYPPFSRLVRLEYRHKDEHAAQEAARAMALQVQNWLEKEDFKSTSLIGPVPCYFARQHDLYRWQIILRGPDPARLLRGKALGEWRVEVDPVSVL